MRIEIDLPDLEVRDLFPRLHDLSHAFVAKDDGEFGTGVVLTSSAMIFRSVPLHNPQARTLTRHS